MPDQWFLARDSLSTLRQALNDPRLQWAYAERMEDNVLLRLSDLFVGPPDLGRWHHGRAFGPTLEIAWWRVGESLSLRVWAESGQPPSGPSWQPDPDGRQAQPLAIEKLLLFGEHDAARARRGEPPAWSAVRIPRYLHYPVAGQPDRVALVVQTYQLAGLRREQRFVELLGVTSDG